MNNFTTELIIGIAVFIWAAIAGVMASMHGIRDGFIRKRVFIKGTREEYLGKYAQMWGAFFLLMALIAFYVCFHVVYSMIERFVFPAPPV